MKNKNKTIVPDGEGEGGVEEEEQQRHRVPLWYSKFWIVSTCTVFLSLSSSFLWAPVLFALSFILQRDFGYRQSRVFMRPREKEKRKKKCQTFPTQSLFRQFSVSGFWCPPPALWFALHSPPSHPIKHCSPGQVILPEPAPPNRPETFCIFMWDFNLSRQRLNYFNNKQFNIITQTFSQIAVT